MVKDKTFTSTYQHYFQQIERDRTSLAKLLCMTEALSFVAFTTVRSHKATVTEPTASVSSPSLEVKSLHMKRRSRIHYLPTNMCKQYIIQTLKQGWCYKASQSKHQPYQKVDKKENDTLTLVICKREFEYFTMCLCLLSVLASSVATGQKELRTVSALS